ncbi:hypothetical protein AAMO2058_000420700 [Amorphochlora amoebiformis]
MRVCLLPVGTFFSYLLGDKIIGEDPFPDQEADLEIIAMNEDALSQIAADFALILEPGDTYYLKGEVGAGKTVFSRAFIRAAYEDEYMPVTSPTFTLVNVYDDLIEYPPIHHYDLYRIQKTEEMFRLELGTILPKVVSLIEWPDRINKMERASRRCELIFEILQLDEMKELGLTSQEIESMKEEHTFPRRIKAYGIGEGWMERLEKVAQALGKRANAGDILGEEKKIDKND